MRRDTAGVVYGKRGRLRLGQGACGYTGRRRRRGRCFSHVPLCQRCLARRVQEVLQLCCVFVGLEG